MEVLVSEVEKMWGGETQRGKYREQKGRRSTSIIAQVNNFAKSVKRRIAFNEGLEHLMSERNQKSQSFSLTSHIWLAQAWLRFLILPGTNCDVRKFGANLMGENNKENEICIVKINTYSLKQSWKPVLTTDLVNDPGEIWALCLTKLTILNFWPKAWTTVSSYMVKHSRRT